MIEQLEPEDNKNGTQHNCFDDSCSNKAVPRGYGRDQATKQDTRDKLTLDAIVRNRTDYNRERRTEDERNMFDALILRSGYHQTTQYSYEYHKPFGMQIISGGESQPEFVGTPDASRIYFMVRMPPCEH